MHDISCGGKLKCIHIITVGQNKSTPCHLAQLPLQLSTRFLARLTLLNLHRLIMSPQRMAKLFLKSILVHMHSLLDSYSLWRHDSPVYCMQKLMY